MGENQLENKQNVNQLTNIMLITANVGSIFEDPKNLLRIWVKEFLNKIKEQKPDFLAIHCQEIGGKTYEESMKHVENFIRLILDSDELKNFKKVCIFLDEDFTSTEKFTALGNIYFIHESIKNLKIFDFQSKEYVEVKGQILHTGNIENVSIKEKDKFPQDFFPECKWSRKGFMRTRWNLNGTKFDLVNIHLFHDASNLIALKESPSPYCKNRQMALKYTLNRFVSDEFEKLPCFIFGDLNFRLDISSVVKKLTAHCELINNDENEKKGSMLFKQEQDEIFLKLDQKVFDLKDTEKTFCDEENLKWLNEHDNELETFKDCLFELPKTFPPSYPFTEDSISSKYMKTRCPSWCDRILFTQQAKELLKNSSNIVYDMIGLNVPMGDHKPILLKFGLAIQNDGEESKSEEDSTEKSGDKDEEKKAIPSLNNLKISNNQTNNQNSDKSSIIQTNEKKNICNNQIKTNDEIESNTHFVRAKYDNSEIPVYRETSV